MEAMVTSCFLYRSSLNQVINYRLITRERQQWDLKHRVEIYNKPTNFQDYFIQTMKKHPNKPSKTHKNKLQLKIKHKPLEHQSLFTPLAPSPRDPPQQPKTDRTYDPSHPDRLKHDEIITPRQARESKNTQYKRSLTDNAKVPGKKKFDQDETGTHTPFVKRVSLTQEGFHKKKSSHSLLSSEKNKLKKKISDKSSKNLSGELSSSTFQRVIGIIIKDYKEGRLKDKQLQQTLLELYQRKQNKKSVGKKKKKQSKHEPFSNQFLKTIRHQTRSQALARRRKQSNSDQEIEERVLERSGFVNKIIIKGITTSMFLKEDDSTSYLKETRMQGQQREPSYHIHTSNSVREINEDMRLIERQINGFNNSSCLNTLEDLMATRIQRAWRRYRTKKLLRAVDFRRCHQDIWNIVDEFTDEEANEVSDSPIDSLKKNQKKEVHEAQTQNYQQLATMILKSLRSEKMGKEECLKAILSFINVNESKLQVDQDSQPSFILDEQKRVDSKVSIQEEKSQDIKSEEDVIQSRVKILEVPKQVQIDEFDELHESPSNELELNSFTNKYSSKEVIENLEFYKQQPAIEENSQMDKSLTFVHLQTSANETFKAINIINIENALQTREDALLNKKEKEVEELTEKLFSNRISKEEYLREKEKVDKWFKHQLKELKMIKKSLLKSCSDACKILENETLTLEPEKSNKMLRCLSDKYIKSKDWAMDRTIAQADQQPKLRVPKKLQSQLSEQDIRVTSFGVKKKIVQGKPLDEPTQCLVFHPKDSYDDEESDRRLDDEKDRRLEISPKMRRISEEPDNITSYNYEQIQKAIEQDEEGLDEGLPQLDKIMHQSSQRFEVNEEDQHLEEPEISLINNFVNEKSRFKYLCQEDKEDIFEFLFLDLVLEMFTDTIAGQSKILRAAEVYIAKAKRLKRIPKGIKTGIAASKEYLKVLANFVMQQKNSLKSLSLPMGPSAVEMLKYMRDEIVQAEEEEAVSSTLVLPIDVFEKVTRLPELELKLERYYDDQERQANRLSFLKTALNINNKSLFDCLNEMLDHQRPYGVWGKPFPWKKVLSLDRKWSRREEESKLKKCIQKTIESCSYLCGILVDKQDSLFGSHRVSEEYVLQIREDRLSKMLANELIENQERWIFYDDQQTQILMEASSFITKKLIKELVLDMMSIKMRI